MQSQAAGSSDKEQMVNDLGPLAWVLDELRKSLDGAAKAIRRFVRDAELARGSDLESLDASQLRIARQQLHQAVGALEMVGLPEPAKVLRAMEALAQKFVQRPEFCSEEAALKVERAGFALIEYLEGVLRGKAPSSVALFPQYRDVLELVGEERIHPADLWPHSWRWIDVELPGPTDPLNYDGALRGQMDAAVLKLVKSGSASAAKALRDVSLGLAAAERTLEARAFWKIGAAYFEALALKLFVPDVYAKRVASRVLMQYNTLARGKNDVSDRLAQDMLFFCAQAAPSEPQAAPVLARVRRAYGLQEAAPVDYEVAQYGRFDPAVLAQARKRISTATETWSTLSGGDTNRLKVVADQFGQVAESLLKLNPENTELARALQKAVDVTIRSGEPPTTPVAMEVATAILYLDAAYEDLDPTESNMRERSERLARRLDRVIAGGQPEPLETWMEELYRRVSDRQTMGSVVEELRTGLSEIEKSLDQFFRNPKDKLPLHEVPSQLAQMRGVFSVLGLDQASVATVRMRDAVEKFLLDNSDDPVAQTRTFEKFGNSLGALGFLIDMLSYQRALAKKLFVYDEELGEFKPLMGREREAAVVAPEPAAPESVALPATVPSRPAALAAAPEEDDGAELREIFLEEAREVVRNGLDAVAALLDDPADLSQQTTLRRAFHTLKGSSRMVGLNEFGEAAWAMEQMMNSWLAEQKPARPELLQLGNAAMQEFGAWVEDIAGGRDARRSAAAFRKSADAMRLESKLVPLEVSGAPAAIGQAAPVAAPPPVEEEEPDEPDFQSTQMFEISLDDEGGSRPDAQDLRPTLEDVSGIDFTSLAKVAPAQPAAAAPRAVPGELSVDWSSVGLSAGVETQAPAVSAPAPEPALAFADFSLPELKIDEAQDAPPPSPASAQTVGLGAFDLDLASVSVSAPEEPVDEQVKVIGPLRIGIPLYNVYLNEADEWSRRLVTELNEWALELHTPLPDSSIALAHSLGGSSSTVGFTALSDIARSLEHAMHHVQPNRPVQPDHVQVFIRAAEELRHLLHQFAAGFLKAPDPALLDALQGIYGTDFADVEHVAAPESGLSPLAPQEAAAGAATTFGTGEIDLGDLSFDFSPPASEPASPAPAVVLEPEPVAPDLPVIDLEPEPAAPELPVIDLEPESVARDLPVIDLEPEAAGQARLQPVSAEPAPAEQRLHQPLAPRAEGKDLPGPAPIVVDEGDEEIDATDVIDPDLFPIFEEEAAELMPQLGAGLRQWADRSDDSAARLDVLRVLHTLKGSARLAGAMRLGEMAHRMESAIEQMGSEYIQAVQVEPLLGRFDRLQHTFDVLCRGGAEDVSGVESAASLPLSAEPSQEPTPRAAVAVPSISPAAPPMAPAPAAAPLARLQPVGSPAAPATSRRPAAASGQTVRVRSQLLDRLVNQTGEVMITRSRLDARLGQLTGSLSELTVNLDRLRSHLRDVEVQAESQMQSRLAQAKDTAQGFDPLEFDRFTRVQELTRMMAESVNDVATVQRNLQQTISGTEDDLIAQARQTRELQRDLLRTRMTEFEGISERLYGVVRQAAKDAGKQVKLDIVGGSMEIDRGVLDRMAPAFEHILRNSVAHGIESPQQREAAGKSAAGTITIGLHQEGNDVSVTFSDDGAGLNLPRIREKAQAQGLLAPGQLLSDDEAANLIFMPGFSTASSVTELSGRGIGMDVVRSEVQALGGRIETATQADVGTSFKLVLPLTTAVTQVIMLRLGELNIGVPASLVEIVRRLATAELERAYQGGHIDYAGEAVPFFWSGALLQASARSQELAGKTQPAVILRSAGQRVAIHVDEVLGNQEVVVKNLGPQLSRLPGLAGMSVLASGAVVLIYNPVALATVYGEKALELQRGTGGKPVMAAASLGESHVKGLAGGEVPLVLVVDDSITVRRVTQRLLRREGYRVALAADGLQALERLAEERPAVVLSDIEMPRMDGFDLARNIRADQKLRDLPIIMITSRIAEKHREHAKELGVDHYLGKPYSEDELLTLVHGYCQQPEAA